MKKKQMKLHLFIGWLLILGIAFLLFPDKNVAVQAERPHLGQLSTRTIVAPINFEVPKTEQEIEQHFMTLGGVLQPERSAKRSESRSLLIMISSRPLFFRR